MTEPSMRETIEAAIDGDTLDPVAAPAAPAESAPAATPASPSAAPAGALAPVAADPPAPKIDPSPFAPVAPKAAAAPLAPVAPELKAPASWKADLREKWKTLPPDVQGEVIRRERENDARMQDHAGVKKFADRFQQIAEPYRAFMEAEGADPLAAFHDYLKTATMLRMGPPADKARMVAQLVNQYQIPLQLLDQYLAQAIQGGGMQQQPQLPQQQHHQQQQFRDPRVDEMLAQQQQYERESLLSDIETFAADSAHEFFADVRETMADVMDAAAKRGVTLGLKDAYARACQIEPEVKKVLDARAARGSASQAARTLAAARHAASSVAPQSAAPAVRTSSAAPGSVRDAIMSSIDVLSNPA